ncbi:DUF397 domain-containing protein [Amycolatopsis sp. NPDC051061]|uniref:DUF397 domain-containing protein n=1 Tax=Amycolatopsis sp. NPDC051061 TaxID=3155042 RepID=UPI00343828F2
MKRKGGRDGPPALNWRKSSYSSGNGGACVEVVETPDGGRYVGDTKDRSLPPHHFTAAEWHAQPLADEG